MTRCSGGLARHLVKMSEREFQAQIRTLSTVLGWLDYHSWTSMHSAAGFPDMVLVKPPRVIFAELKTENGTVSPHQQFWLDTLKQCSGVEVYLWRPSDWNTIVEILKRGGKL